MNYFKSLSFAVLCFTLVGCSGSQFEFAEVEGVVTQDGQPLPEVKITFSPDPERVTTPARASHAVTDENGRFRLKYSGPETEFGAQVGWHFVTALDFKAENSRDNPIPVRIAAKYSQAAKSDLEFEVKASEAPQEINFELEGR